MFRKIPGYDNYIINESGIIIDRNNNPVRVSVNNDGYMYAYLDNKKEYIHDLVGRTFLKLDDSFKYVSHRNNDILDNHVSNLFATKMKIHIDELPNRSHRRYSSSKYIYEVFNEEDVIQCIGRGQVAELIQYEEISLKNMVGNGRKIAIGPYKGYQIRRVINQEEK